MLSEVQEQGGAVSPFDFLTDDLLAAVLANVPEHTARLMEGGVLLSTRGATEQVCRRWRQAALSHPRLRPSLLELDFITLEEHYTYDPSDSDQEWSSDGEGGWLSDAEFGGRDADAQPCFEYIMDELHVCLAGRRPRAVTIGRTPPQMHYDVDGHNPGTFEETLWAPLVWALQEAERVALQPGHVDASLELLRRCPAVQELVWQPMQEEEYFYPDKEEALLLAEAVSQQPALTHIELHLQTLPPQLAAAVAALPPLVRARFFIDHCPPDPDSWQHLRQLGARLELLSVEMDRQDAVQQERSERLALVLPELAQLPCVNEMRLLASWPNPAEAAAGNAAPLPLPDLPGVDHLPSLRCLRLSGGVPSQLWGCQQLTALTVCCARLALPADQVAARQLCSQLSRLLRLELSHVSFRSGGAGSDFPAALCVLPALSQLELSRCRFGCLPDQMSNLRSLLELHIRDTDLSHEAGSLQALGPLTSLTLLHLQKCRLADLPAGAYLGGLQELDISGNRMHGVGRPVLPPVAAAANRLRRLALTFNEARNKAQRQWGELKPSLEHLACLKELSVQLAPTGADAPVSRIMGSSQGELDTVRWLQRRLSDERLPFHCVIRWSWNLSSKVPAARSQ